MKAICLNYSRLTERRLPGDGNNGGILLYGMGINGYLGIPLRYQGVTFVPEYMTKYWNCFVLVFVLSVKLFTHVSNILKRCARKKDTHFGRINYLFFSLKQITLWKCLRVE